MSPHEEMGHLSENDPELTPRGESPEDKKAFVITASHLFKTFNRCMENVKLNKTNKQKSHIKR